jgi:N-acetylneuraminate synthase
MVEIIAEAGVNHNGNVKRAFEMIECAADAGADYIKFQTFIPEEVISVHAPKADYQRQATGNDESQLDMVRALALGDDVHVQLKERCEELEIGFLSTPFDLISLRFLTKTLQLDTIKIPSGELTTGPLLLAAARSGANIILSTGMANLREVETALLLLVFGYSNKQDVPDIDALGTQRFSPDNRNILESKVTLLHCTTEYPAPFKDLNLNAMQTLHDEFGLSTGLSDHSTGVIAAIAATAMGATVIEKHFTLDKGLPGPDHKASLSTDELRELVSSIRTVETMLGDPTKKITPSEATNLPIARKSVVARCSIRRGTVLSEDNLATKRPGTGISPMQYWRLLGTVASRDYQPDELIEEA